MSASGVDPQLLNSLPADVLKTLPAAQPPRGAQANFDDPPTRVPVILTVGVIFFVLALQSYITTIVITPALGLIKSCLFIQYYMVFHPLRWVRIAVWIGLSISTVFYVVVSIAALLLESPWPGESFLDDILSTHYLFFANFSIPVGVVGMLVDWYLFIIPVPAVWGLHMSSTKKLGLLVIFMTGGL
ncbi:MAG: hypothetical protein Q9170_007775, partial [Blastenia crenularia]